MLANREGVDPRRIGQHGFADHVAKGLRLRARLDGFVDGDVPERVEAELKRVERLRHPYRISPREACSSFAKLRGRSCTC